MSTPQSPDHRTAPLPLWRAAGDLVRTIFHLFGAPEELAAQYALTKKTRDLLLRWLRAGEAVIRRLLLLEALALAPQPFQRTRSRAQPRQRQLCTFTAEHPEQWRVCFRTTAPSPRAASRNKPRAAAHARFYSPWPLAERMEAMLRAYNEPGPYALRLARRLRAAPALARRIIAVTPDTESYYGHAGFAVLDAAIELAVAARGDTS